ncbi:cuticle protein 10.9-like [Tachypleus tridentatus]|uniref:cuticle protein 10.9-like n=1 Tax=Tachypleus tridentatus TaxID=6853 RepID=UPI003FD55317
MFKAVVFLTVVAGAFGGYISAPYGYHPDPYYAAPEPYNFGFQTADEFGTQLSRQETGDGSGAVTGSYGYADANGIWRQVRYVADGAGFRAEVDTNEPGTDNQNPADVIVSANPAPVVYKHAPVVKHVVPAAHLYAPYAHPVVKAVKLH